MRIRKFLKKPACFVLSAALLLGMAGTSPFIYRNVVAQESSVSVELQDSSFTGSLWDDGVWTATMDIWSNGGSGSIKNDSADDDHPNCVNFYMGTAGTTTITQTLDLEAGTYHFESDVMGNGATVKFSIGSKTSDGTALTGWGNWLTAEGDITIAEDIDAAVVGFSIDCEEGGWGDIDNITLTMTPAETTTTTTTTEEKTETTTEKATETIGETMSTEITEAFQTTQCITTETGTTEEPEVSDTETSKFEEKDGYAWTETDYVLNGDFENELTNWNVVMDTDDDASTGYGYKVKTDAWASNETSFLNVWNNSAESIPMSLTQKVTLPAGSYKLTFQQEGAESESGLYVTVNGAATKLAATTGWDKWANVETEPFVLDKETEVLIMFSGDVAAGYWGDIDDVQILAYTEEEDTAVDAGIYVAKIKGVDDEFITGADVSSYISIRNSGAKFYDFDGNEVENQSFFNLLAESGVNYVRVRVWNDPYDSDGNGYGGGNNDLATAVEIGQYATKAGMKVLIDFHYSDFWADPSKQQAPKAWSSMSIDEKAAAIKTYTTSSLNTLISAGVDVGMVQIGNETNGSFCGTSDFEEMCKLFNAGSSAVRSISKDILVALHFTDPQTAGLQESYAAQLDEYDVDYDVFASSYYPYWHGSISNLKSVLSNIAKTYGKKVMVAETSWATTYEDGDGHVNTIREDATGISINYSISQQGQANEMHDVCEAIASIDDGIGVFYWEPAWIPVQEYKGTDDEKAEILAENKTLWEKYGSGWASSYADEYDPDDAGKWYGGSAVDNQSWFDFSGHPLETLKIYNYLRSGASTEKVVDEVTLDTSEATICLGDRFEFPETANVVYNDRTSETVEVSWNQDDADKANNIGSYKITGTVTVDDKDYTVTFTLTINPENLIINPGFEESDTSMWKLTTDPEDVAGIREDSSNVRKGAKCLHFWSDADFTYELTQDIELSAGVYKLGSYLQGGSAGTGDSFVLYAIVDGEKYTCDSALNGWQSWDNPEIADIEVKEDTTVTIGVEVKASAGAWGSWDDFYLYKTGDITEDDGTPYIEGDEEHQGWTTVKNKIEDVINSAEGTKVVTVVMNGAVEVPGYIFDSIKGTDLSVEFVMDNDIKWTVNGNDVTGTAIKDINFAAELGSDESAITDDIIATVFNKITGEKQKLTLAHSGDFGFTAYMSIGLDEKNAGLYANLFYYDESTKKFEFQCSGKIAEDGNASLEFTHASDYLIVISEKSLEPETSTTQVSTETTTGASTQVSTETTTGASTEATTATTAPSTEATTASTTVTTAAATGSTTQAPAAAVTTTEAQNTNSPKTGDNSAVLFVFVALVMSGCAALVALRKREER